MKRSIKLMMAILVCVALVSCSNPTEQDTVEAGTWGVSVWDSVRWGQ